MKVILIAKIKNLGEKGEVREVTKGYARNFLFPRRLAVLATPKLIEQAEAKKKEEYEQLEKRRAEYKKAITEIKGRVVKLTVSVNKKGNLFASITPAMIADGLAKYGILPEQIIINEPIKKLGEYEVEVKPLEGLSAKIKVVVEGENPKSQSLNVKSGSKA